MDEEKSSQLPKLETEPSCELEKKWAQKVKSHGEEIITCLNPLELLTYFDAHELLSSDDKDVMLMDNKTRRDKVRHLLKVLETRDDRDAPYTLFVKCLKEEIQRSGFHLGHQYLLAILKGEQYGSDDERRTSEVYK